MRLFFLHSENVVFLVVIIGYEKIIKFIRFIGDIMDILGPFLITTIAGLSTVLGALVIFFRWREEHIDRFITFCLSLSLAVMIGLSVTELIPESTFVIITNYKLAKGIFACLVTFLIGVILIFWLNKKMKYMNQEDLYKLGLLSMLALILHNLPEGIATFMSSCKDMNLGIKLAIAITLHNIPEGITIAVPIYYATKNKREAIFKTLLSGLTEPLGALLAYLFLSRFITDSFIALILLFVAGIMITLSIQKLFPEALKYKENKYIWIGMGVGVGFILLNYFLL